jgi:hypothetical protein
MYGGVSLNPRGTSVKARTGPVGASISDYGHTIRLGIPGMYGFNFGEDYTYGATASVGYSPVVGGIGGVKVRAGGKIDVFHASPVALGAMAGGCAGLGAVLAGIAVPPLAWLALPAAGAIVVGSVFPYARKLARGIAIGADAVYRPIARWIHRAAHKLGLVDSEPKTHENGWPLTERWNLAKRATERAEAAGALAGERLKVLQAIDPESIGMPNPREAHATMVAHLQSVVRAVEAESAELKTLAAKTIAGEKIDKDRMKELAASLERHAIAFEFVDVLISSVAGGGEAAPLEELPLAV